MTLYAGFQSSVTFPAVAFAGDWFGEPLYNSGKGYIVDSTSSGQAIGTFCWGLVGNNNSQITPFKGSNTQIAGFVVREQTSSWVGTNVDLGYNTTIAPGQSCTVIQNGSFYAIAASLNGGGVIVAGDILVLNDTTGVLYSQTSATIPSGYTQITGYKVINAAPGEYSTDNTTTNLVVISNVLSF
jgi:hypothetical protein